MSFYMKIIKKQDTRLRRIGTREKFHRRTIFNIVLSMCLSVWIIFITLVTRLHYNIERK